MSDEDGTLFVYGTLMRGERAHHLLQGCRFIAEDQTVPGYGLVHVTWFPGLIRASSGTVRGEIYAVPASRWTELDDYEDCPKVYTRVEIALASGRRANAYLYRRPEGLPRIATGDWRKRDP